MIKSLPPGACAVTVPRQQRQLGRNSNPRRIKHYPKPHLFSQFSQNSPSLGSSRRGWKTSGCKSCGFSGMESCAIWKPVTQFSTKAISADEDAMWCPVGLQARQGMTLVLLKETCHTLFLVTAFKTVPAPLRSTQAVPSARTWVPAGLQAIQPVISSNFTRLYNSWRWRSIFMPWSQSMIFSFGLQTIHHTMLTAATSSALESLPPVKAFHLSIVFRLQGTWVCSH